MTKKNYHIDVGNKSFGRAASETAIILRGKNLPTFQPNIVPDAKVKIINLSKVKFTGSKLKGKTKKRYSGYPGGLKIIPFKTLFKKSPEDCFKKAVEGMLPKNKLRKQMLKNLIFE